MKVRDILRWYSSRPATLRRCSALRCCLVCADVGEDRTRLRRDSLESTEYKEEGAHCSKEIILSRKPECIEENFLKMPAKYITATHEFVRGVFLVTPTSVMFDPDPNDPLVAELGCDKFEAMFSMISIVAITMYKRPKSSADWDCINFDQSALKWKADLSNWAEFDAGSIDHGGKTASASGGAAGLLPLAGEPHFLSGSAEVEGSRSKPSCNNVNVGWYICIRSHHPIMKNLPLICSFNEKSEKVFAMEDEVHESWFQVPEGRSDKLLSYFMQWSPDHYQVDFAEHGFAMVDTQAENKKAKKKANVEKAAKKKRGRSSTNSSLKFVDGFFGDKNSDIDEKWELISIEETKKRTTLNANELADDDASLIPELLHNSVLLNDETLLTLCKHMPPRCIGYPLKLLYSTYEHGISLKTLYRKMNKRYEDTPVILLIQDHESTIFGAYCSCRPSVSERFYGTGESFLFTLQPTAQFFDWTGENNFFIKGDVDALMFGGGDGSAGLWLDSDLNRGCTRQCHTFNNLLLSSNEDFLIHGVEVWGIHDS